MKRDMDLIRHLLLAVEAGKEYRTIPGFTQDQIGYHVWLLGEAGYMDVVERTTMGSPVRQALPGLGGLTWTGHEFLDNARSETVWNSAKDKASKLGGVGLDVMKELLVATVKGQLGLQ